MSNDRSDVQPKHIKDRDLSFLMGTSLFNAVPREACGKLLAGMRVLELENGEPLISQGEEGDCFYVVQEGNLLITRQEDGADRVIGMVGPGEIAGEMALVTGDPRSASVVANTDVRVWMVGRRLFEDTCTEFPELRKFLTWLVANRLSRSFLAADKSFGKYKIHDLIGHGASSLVYRGVHESLGMPVAVKMLKHNMALDRDFRELFGREARTVARLNHPNIVKIFDIEERYRTFFIVMEHVGGGSLHTVLARKQRLFPEEGLRMLLELCSGLEYAHRMGVIHRDIKPGNVLLGEDERVKIVDFGYACRPGTKATEAIGTIYYISPEAIKLQPLDERSDIYSLGCMAYEMFTGQKPSGQGSQREILNWHVKRDIDDPREHAADIPSDLVDVLRRATHRDPAHRFQSVDEMSAALARIASGLGADHAVPTPHEMSMTALYVFHDSHRSELLQRLIAEFGREVSKTGCELHVSQLNGIRTRAVGID